MGSPSTSSLKIIKAAQFIGAYFISFVLVAFAISKFFNAQFQIYNYSGYVPLKDISPFTHAWSFFGRSYNYNLFLGIAEFIAGTFILFRRTRLAGLLIALTIFINVLIIDIEFNVANAIGHVTIEILIVLLLLIPYLKDLKTFFWDREGKLNRQAESSKKLFSVYIPLIFLILVTAGFAWETSTALQSQDKLIGEYQLKQLIINADTVKLEGGKYTRTPMIFFEFGNTTILSFNDSTYWGSYYIKEDTIEVIMDKEIYNFKNMEGRLHQNKGMISGLTSEKEEIQIIFSPVSED